MGLFALVSANPACHDGDAWCSNSTTAVFCEFEHEQFLFACPDSQHCAMMPHHPTPCCKDGSGSSSAASTTPSYSFPVAVALRDIRDVAQASNEHDNDSNNDVVSTEGKCTEGQLWKHRADCYKCENGKEKIVRHCRRHYACTIYEGNPQCVRSSPFIGWRRTRNTIDIDIDIDSPPSEAKPIHPTPRHESECTEGQESCCSKHLACKCLSGILRPLHECPTRSCAVENGRAICKARVRLSALPSGASATTNVPATGVVSMTSSLTQSINTLSTSISISTSTSSAMPIPIPMDNGVNCGFCTSLQGLNVPLRTSNNTCINHPDSDGAYASCLNQWCGLCYFLRDCQGEIKWSGARGSGSGYRKGRHGKSHFCM
ncbi:hypothetical protein J1614_001627, partial [Plenodomus biglobosus]